jgi:hypothetical protein
MIYQRKLVSAWIGFLSMCDAACANSCFMSMPHSDLPPQKDNTEEIKKKNL